MGKLTSLIAGFIAICIISFYFLSVPYNALINWIGPLAGPEIIYALGFLFLFFGNPLYNPAILGSWILLGFVVAAGSRRGLRSVGAAVSLFFLALLFFGTVVSAMLLPIVTGTSGISTSLSHFPPVPPGTSLAGITSLPVIGGLLTVVESFIQNLNIFGSAVPVGSGTSAAPALGLSSFQYTKFITYFLYPLIANLAILLISAGLFGYFFGQIARGKKASSRKHGAAVALFLIAMLLLTGLSVLSDQNTQPYQGTGIQMYKAPSASVAGLSDFNFSDRFVSSGTSVLAAASNSPSPDPYYEAAASYVSLHGSIFNFYAFAKAYNGSTQMSSFFNTTGVTSSALTFLMGSSGLVNFSYSHSGLNLPSFLSSVNSPSILGLLPGLLLVSVYPGNINVTTPTFNGELQTLENNLNTKLSRIFVYSATLSGYGTSSIYIYGTDSEFSGFASAFRNYSVSNFSGNGLINAFSDGISSGRFVPGTAGCDVNGSVFFSAYMNTGYAAGLGEFGSSITNVSSSWKNLALVGGITVSRYAYHSSSILHRISLADTTGSGSKIFFSPDASGSAVIIGAPDTTNETGTPVQNFNYSGYYSSSTVLSMLPFSGGNFTSLNYTPTTGINPAALNVSSAWTYPYNMTVSVHMKMNSGRVIVNTTLSNHDVESISNINVDERTFVQSYPSGIGNLSAVPFFSLNSLAPGTSHTFSFSFIPDGPGVYTMSTVNVSYPEYVASLSRTISVNLTYSGNSLHIYPPDFATSANGAEYSAITAIAHYASGLSIFTYSLLPGFYIFDLIILLIIVADVWIEWRSYKRKRDAKNRTIEL